MYYILHNLLLLQICIKHYFVITEMYCCKQQSSILSDLKQMEEDEMNHFEMIETKEGILLSGFSDLDVKEWTMELRENYVQMDAYNVKLKEEKMKDIKEREVKQRQARERDIKEKQRRIENERKELKDQRIQIEERISRQNEVDEGEESTHFEQELYEKRQRLKAKQFEIQEKNDILEITLKINKKEEKLALQLKNSKAITLANDENQLVDTREREIEERENELTLRQQSLEERELQLEESSILDIAICLNQFRFKYHFATYQ